LFYEKLFLYFFVFSTPYSRFTHPKQVMWRVLASLMCSDCQGSYFRYYRWNFTQLADPEERIGTIEFRQPAGSTERAHAFCWTAFALSFVAGAYEYVDSLNPNEVASLQKLQQMIRIGAVKIFRDPLPDPLSYVEPPVLEGRSDPVT
jgi:hypothetical protein